MFTRVSGPSRKSALVSDLKAYPGRPQSVADGGKYPAGAGFGITGRKAEKAGKKLKKWLAFLERECYTVKRTFVNAFFFCAQKTGFFHHEQARECVLAKKEKGGFT